MSTVSSMPSDDPPTKRDRLSVVVPIYKNEQGIPSLLTALDGLFEADDTLEAVLVVDGSPDESFALLRDELPNCRFPSRLVLLSRNFGSFAAVRAGLRT